MRAARAKPTTRDAVIALARRVRRPEPEVLEDWEERAAIREFEGAQPRFLAEDGALDDLRRMYETQRTFKAMET